MRERGGGEKRDNTERERERERRNVELRSVITGNMKIRMASVSSRDVTFRKPRIIRNYS